jgi:DNA polymerase III epsilon subunit-like protein
MSLDFVAIDFETANYFRGSPCAVGMVTIRDGQVVDQWEQLIYQDHFDGFCISIHGITPDDVADAPTWTEISPVIAERIGDLPLVAHNAAFDTGVMRDANADTGLVWPTLDYACTLVASRRTYDLPSYRLPYVAEAAGFPFNSETHHKAIHDAIAAAWIMFDIANRADAATIHDTLTNLNIRLGHITADDWIGCSSRGRPARAGFGLAAGDFTINPDADPENPLYGMGVTFTGTLSSMTRALAWQKVADCGGMPLDGVTKKTNLLVFGYQDARMLAPGATLSSKYTKALTLKEKGADIEIIGEDDFLTMLQEAGIKAL